LDAVAPQVIDPVEPHGGRCSRRTDEVLTKETGPMRFMVDLDPRATVPAHGHDGAEDSYVIRGSCDVVDSA
jgi:quercetin dioxygenase-like cupin family protein